MSLLHFGHFKVASEEAFASAAAAPQCGQWRLPMNIMAKHEGQATVASFDSQNLQRGESEEMAAPQLGQLRVSAFIESDGRDGSSPCQLNIAETSLRKNPGPGLRLK
jgi:hypothetical protein